MLVSSVCPSVRMEQFDAHWKKIREILQWTPPLEICRKYSGFFKIGQKHRKLHMDTQVMCTIISR